MTATDLAIAVTYVAQVAGILTVLAVLVAWLGGHVTDGRPQ